MDNLIVNKNVTGTFFFLLQEPKNCFGLLLDHFSAKKLASACPSNAFISQPPPA